MFARVRSVIRLLHRLRERWNAFSGKRPIKKITALDLRQKLDRGEGVQLVDCREEREWTTGRIPQAVLIPLGELKSSRHGEVGQGEVIVYCAAGVRSMNACLFLQDLGYKNLANLEGGIQSWAAQGLSLETD